MIGYIKGNVLNIKDGVALIENNGIGYEITCSKSALANFTDKGEVYTYLAVKEDGVSLYGFSCIEEKQMFLKLISVSGVGPKMGITVLSGMNLNDLAVKIATNDVKGLSTIKGLGKKTAERIILELREKVSAEISAVSEEKEQENTKPVNEDAVFALMSLGFTKKECEGAVKEAEDNGITEISAIVTYALKHIR